MALEDVIIEPCALLPRCLDSCFSSFPVYPVIWPFQGNGMSVMPRLRAWALEPEAWLCHPMSIPVWPWASYFTSVSQFICKMARQYLLYSVTVRIKWDNAYKVHSTVAGHVVRAISIGSFWVPHTWDNNMRCVVPCLNNIPLLVHLANFFNTPLKY